MPCLGEPLDCEDLISAWGGSLQSVHQHFHVYGDTNFRGLSAIRTFHLITFSCMLVSARQHAHNFVQLVYI